VWQLKSLKLHPTVGPLFSEVLRDVWKQKKADQEVTTTTARRRIGELEQRRQKIFDLFADGKITQDVYDDQTARVGTDLQQAESVLAEGLIELQELEFLQSLQSGYYGTYTTSGAVHHSRIRYDSSTLCFQTA
jgi:hypothetical protein